MGRGVVKCSLSADTFTAAMSDPGQPWYLLKRHQLYLPEETVYYMTPDTHVLAFSISIPQMGNLRHQITLGRLVGSPETREMYLPLWTPTLYFCQCYLHQLHTPKPETTGDLQKGSAKNELIPEQEGDKASVQNEFKRVIGERSNTRD